MHPGSRTVYVDFDDVLCATARGFLDVLRREFGKTIEFEDIVDFDLGRSFALAPAELERFFDAVHEADVLAGFEPVEGAFEALSAWQELGYEIEVVTGRPPDTRKASEAWLAAHEVAYDDLTFVAKYDHAPGGTPLDEIVARDYAWVVEDSFATAERLAIGGHRVHLLDRPWNRLASRADDKIRRCADWNEVRLSVEA
ncbi:MAG: bifunctional metallophosphatase/5'-nucleotidase [bacterium]|nr:bifunctional metallophosphatase/5'-nucleotidase [bacterium]